MGLAAKKYPSDIAVEPQAIAWRPIIEFSTCLYEGQDALDHYIGASFSYGNSFHFDIRVYREHPQDTCTFYLPIEYKSLSDIRIGIREITSHLALPGYAFAWRRGEPFEYGTLRRQENDRLRESEARILALKIAALSRDRFASTEHIKSQIPKYYPLSPRDLLPSPTRAPEPRWEQIVRNVISHRSNPHGPFEKGYAEKISDGIRVTEDGILYLKSIGFCCD